LSAANDQKLAAPKIYRRNLRENLFTSFIKQLLSALHGRVLKSQRRGDWQIEHNGQAKSEGGIPLVLTAVCGQTSPRPDRAFVDVFVPNAIEQGATEEGMAKALAAWLDKEPNLRSYSVTFNPQCASLEDFFIAISEA
jgi:hypothetical protein